MNKIKLYLLRCYYFIYVIIVGLGVILLAFLFVGIGYLLSETEVVYKELYYDFLMDSLFTYRTDDHLLDFFLEDFTFDELMSRKQTRNLLCNKFFYYFGKGIVHQLVVIYYDKQNRQCPYKLYTE